MGAAFNPVSGHSAWSYYETIGGGMGASAKAKGVDAVQTHMTNTRNSPIEVLELNYPVRVRKYEIRKDSAGTGRHPGGEGIVRHFEFLAEASVTILSERRRHRPWGLSGGGDGASGENFHNEKPLPGKVSLQVKIGDMITLKTPGGGGWG
jgi:N-methylhydantoinase B